MSTHSRGNNVKRVEVVWPEDLVAQIDSVRGQHSRSAWLRRLAEGGLAGNMQDSLKAQRYEDMGFKKDFNALQKLDSEIGEIKKSARQLLAERTAQMRGNR